MLDFHEKLALMELAAKVEGADSPNDFEARYELLLKLALDDDQVFQKLRPVIYPFSGDLSLTKCPVCGTDCHLARSPKKSKDEIDKNTKSCLFHKLWTKAVGKTDYDKQEWLTLERMVNGF